MKKKPSKIVSFMVITILIMLSCSTSNLSVIANYKPVPEMDYNLNISSNVNLRAGETFNMDFKVNSIINKTTFQQEYLVNVFKLKDINVYPSDPGVQSFINSIAGNQVAYKTDIRGKIIEFSQNEITEKFYFIIPAIMIIFPDFPQGNLTQGFTFKNEYEVDFNFQNSIIRAIIKINNELETIESSDGKLTSNWQSTLNGTITENSSGNELGTINGTRNFTFNHTLGIIEANEIKADVDFEIRVIWNYLPIKVKTHANINIDLEAIN